jgi:hypothetical protein
MRVLTLQQVRCPSMSPISMRVGALSRHERRLLCAIFLHEVFAAR